MARRDDDDDDDDRPRRRRRDDDADDIPAHVPRTYVHEKCDGQTRMPAEEIRAYLDNPFELDEDPLTYCTECDKDVPWKKCYWAETEQNCYEYLDDLRAEMVINDNDPRTGPGYAWWFPVGFAIGLGLAVGVGGRRAVGLGLIPGLIAAVVGAGAGAIWMFVQHSRDKKATEEWNRKLVSRYYKRYPELKKQKKSRRQTDEDDE